MTKLKTQSVYTLKDLSDDGKTFGHLKKVEDVIVMDKEQLKKILWGTYCEFMDKKDASGFESYFNSLFE